MPPTQVSVPANTTAIYLSAISLSPSPSEISIGWSLDTATFGTTFIGPSPNHILSDKVFGSPIAVVEGGTIPETLAIDFDFLDAEGPSALVEAPVTTLAGPAGCQTVVYVTAYAADDGERRFPTSVTVVMRRPMAGILRGAAAA